MATTLTTYTTPTSQNPGIEYHLSYSVVARGNGTATFRIYWSVYTTSGSFAYNLWLYGKIGTVVANDKVVSGSDGITSTSANSGSFDLAVTGLAAAGGSVTLSLYGVRATSLPSGSTPDDYPDDSTGSTGVGSTTRTLSYSSYYLDPAPVTAQTATRINATTNRVTWANHPTSSGPYSSISVERSSDKGATYSTVYSSLGGTATSCDDTAADSAYSWRYRIRVAGAGGTSAYAYTTDTMRIPTQALSLVGVMTVTDDPANDGAKVANSAQVTVDHPSFVAENTPTTLDLELWDARSNAWAAYSTSAYVVEDKTMLNVVGLTADNTYLARVRYNNTAGASAWTQSPAMVTTVAAPTGPVVTTKLGAARSGVNISLSWLINSIVATNTDVYWSNSADSGNSWSPWTKITTIAGGTQNYTHPSPDASKQHKYYVANKTDTGLVSHPLYSDPVVLLTVPNAPTISGSPYASKTDQYFDIADMPAVTLSWVHNPVDGTAQTKYEIQTRESGAAWPETTPTVTATASHSFTIPLNGKTYEWRVRTWGSHTDPSAWSATGSFKTSAKPTLVVTRPAAPAAGSWRLWPAPSLTVTHTYTDAEGKAQTKHRTELYDEAGTTLLWYAESSNADLTEEIKYTLQDGTGTKTDGLWSVPSRYVIKKKVMDSDGLWSTVFTRQIEVVWDTPPANPEPPITLSAAVEDTTATISWTAPASADDGAVGDSGKRPWTQVSIERWDNLSGVWTFVKNVATRVSGSTTDTVEPNRQYKYRIKAQATATSSADNSITLTASSPILTQSSYLYTEPESPATVSVTQPSDIVIVAWSNEATYPAQIEIQRKNNSVGGSVFVTVATVDASQEQFPDISVNGDTSYSYRVVAVANGQYGEYSATSTLITKSSTNVTLQGVTVPPVRRNGPRESVKENVEAAEIGAIAALVREKVGTLKTDITALSAGIGANNEALYQGIEPARHKTEMK